MKRLILILALSLALPVFSEKDSFIDDNYRAAHISQDSGAYGSWLGKLGKAKGTEKAIRNEIIENLDRLKKLPSKQREEGASELLFHYSKTHGRYKATPLKLDQKIGVSLEDFKAGKFDSKEVAEALMKASAAYERDVLFPMYSQIEGELREEFPGRQVLFLGRDFTSPYLFIDARGTLDPKKIHMANISRAIRDELEDGSSKKLWQLFDQMGLTKEALTRDGLVIVDSSMTGDVPAAVLKGLVEGLNDERDIYNILSKSHVRFLESDAKSGRSIGRQARDAGRDGRLSKRDALGMVRQLDGIDTFKYRIPKGLDAFEGHAHNLIEHRPKFLTSPSGFASSSKDYRLESKAPSDPGGRIKALLGLQADLLLMEEAPNCNGRYSKVAR